MFGFLSEFYKQKKVKSPRVSSEFVTLIILDGFGIHPDPEGNAVLQAKTPFLDTIWSKATHTMLHASGIHVGLPAEEHGNSEVGHLNIGTGRVVYQSLPKINDAIKTGKFFENETLLEAFKEVKKRRTKLHFMGILSAGGVHGHINHLFALLDMAKQNGVDPYIHVILDGRDTGLTDGYFYLSKLNQKTHKLGIGHIASVSGRFYAMDRDHRWERTASAYNAMTGVEGRRFNDPFSLVQQAYKDGENDQILKPTIIVDSDNKPVGPIQNNDVVIFYNFREDRARQITKAFVLPDEDFHFFDRNVDPKSLYFVTMMGYEEGLPVHVVFSSVRINDSLSDVLAQHQFNQLHISETEKHMHVTYFFNGGREVHKENEEFFNIPSPKVFSYATTPFMSADIIRDEVVYRLDNFDKKKYSFFVINFANPDMLGHTGNLEKTVEANEHVDSLVEEIVKKVVNLKGVAIIIADHGNCETMIDRATKEVNTYHTSNPVPFILVKDVEETVRTKDDKIVKIGTGETNVSGMLADVAPTILAILGLPQPDTMTGIDLTGVL